jgi:hypothetical protein
MAQPCVCVVSHWCVVGGIVCGCQLVVVAVAAWIYAPYRNQSDAFSLTVRVLFRAAVVLLLCCADVVAVQ